MFWKKARVLLLRALLLRCPVCGQGKIYSGVFKTYDNCPACGFQFEREPGYYTGAMAANLVLTEFLLTAVAVPLALTPSIPLVPLIAFGTLLAILFPLICYRHTKSLWMAFDHLIHPVSNERVYRELT